MPIVREKYVVYVFANQEVRVTTVHGTWTNRDLAWKFAHAIEKREPDSLAVVIALAPKTIKGALQWIGWAK